MTLSDRLRAYWARGRHHWVRTLVRIRKRVPPGARLLLGLLFIAGGFLAILPVFGLWMIPFGIAIAALDVKPILRWLRAR